MMNLQFVSFGFLYENYFLLVIKILNYFFMGL